MAEIEPLKIEVRSADGGGSEVVFEFTEPFRSLGIDQQVMAFVKYLGKLSTEIQALQPDHHAYGWLVMVHQVSEQILDYIKSGELDLAEPLVITVEQEKSRDFSIMDFL